MQRFLKVLMLSATIAAVSAPVPARADTYISPFAGVNFGNNSGNGRVNVGADAGWMGAGIIGAEVDFGYAPNVFGNKGAFGGNSVTDVMGFFSKHGGVRADVRYFRNLSDTSSVNNLNIDFGSLHFWRASIGVVLRP